jgi:hypothetical protein
VLLARWQARLTSESAGLLAGLCAVYGIIDDAILIFLTENDFYDLGLPRWIARTIPWGLDDPLWETLWGDVSSDDEYHVSTTDEYTSALRPLHPPSPGNSALGRSGNPPPAPTHHV